MVTFSAALEEIKTLKTNLKTIKNDALLTLMPILETYKNEHNQLIEAHASIIGFITETTFEVSDDELRKKLDRYKNLLENIAKNPTRSQANKSLLQKLKTDISATAESLNTSEDEKPLVFKRLTLLTDFLIEQNTALIKNIKKTTDIKETIRFTLEKYQEQVDDIDRTIQRITGEGGPEPRIEHYQRNFQGNFVRKQ